MSRYIMLVNSEKCMNCKACVVACQQRNGVPYGHYRCWVKEAEDKDSLNGRHYQPGACMHCDSPLCVDACPTRATYKASDGSVRIDRERCIGCGGCIAACPYDARFKNPLTGTADKCDYCAKTAGSGIPPACVLACPTRCRTFGDADDPKDPVAKILAANKLVHVKGPGQDTRPTLAYLNKTLPTDWPRRAEVPAPLAAVGPISSAVKLLGGIVLFGLTGVFVRNLRTPQDSDTAHADKGGGK